MQNQTDKALELMSQFRNEFFSAISKNFRPQYPLLKIKTAPSVCLMLISVGVADMHAALVNRVCGVTLSNPELRNHHLATGSIVYALMSGIGTQAEADAASADFASLYDGFDSVRDEKDMAAFIDTGFQLAALVRGMLENPENPTLQKQVAVEFNNVSGRIGSIYDRVR